ncbi:MAG: PhoH family protein, partial [Brevinematales bacterium]|nr:PhoH family protein [Brevinematales bacterium]
MMDNLAAIVKEGEYPSPEYIRALAVEFTESEPAALDTRSHDSIIQIPHGFGRVYPRSRNQSSYVQAMRENEICFCVGPAGTGKTYLAIAQALQAVLSKKMRKL